MELERRCFVSTLGIEKREAGTKAQIVGHAAVFNKLSENLGGFKERIAPGAFKKAIKTSDARALINHESRLILGRQSAGTLTLAEDDEGLLSRIDPPDTTYANDLMISLRRRDIQEMSFGFTVSAEEWDGLETEMPTRTLLEVKDLFDVSPVTFPAYQDTEVALRSLREARGQGKQFYYRFKEETPPGLISIPVVREIPENPVFWFYDCSTGETIRTLQQDCSTSSVTTGEGDLLISETKETVEKKTTTKTARSYFEEVVR